MEQPGVADSQGSILDSEAAGDHGVVQQAAPAAVATHTMKETPSTSAAAVYGGIPKADNAEPVSVQPEKDQSTLDMQSKLKEDDDADKERLNLERRKQLLLRAKAATNVFLESTPVVIVMSTITLWALFSDDIRQAGTYKTADLGFTVVISICFFLFATEILLACFAKGQEYLYIPPNQFRMKGEGMITSLVRRFSIGSFYFWLDLVATLSLIFEIEWMIGDSLSSGAQAASGGSATKAGARAGRIVRLVRMVRLIRMVRLYKYATKLSTSANASEGEVTVVTNVEGEAEEITQESRVGAALTDLTNRRVIILVLVILIVVPNLDAVDDDVFPSVVTQVIHALARKYFQSANGAQQYLAALKLTIAQAVAYSKASNIENDHLLRVNFQGQAVPGGNADWYFDSSRYNALRTSEMLIVHMDEETLTTTLTFDIRYQTTQQALFGIYTTLYVIVILITGTLFFSSDVTRLVITPVEKMVALVQKISVNPLGVQYKMLGEEDGFVAGMETTVLLTTITKIGGLMRVGFGEAGADVIANNLNDSAGGKLNLMGGGNMITSIFGFCDVRQFTDTTECLQEEVMLFVNRIAHILHNIVVQCSGSANKNIGDAFLLTWKLTDGLKDDEICKLTDQALYAFCKTLVELNRYATFICNFSVAATARLYKRFPNYSVRIGSGLHVGWAIEGAIGSNRKIDASYLSPHVNMTEFLESSTKAYGVPLLMSEPFYKLLSSDAKSYIRQVDRIRKTEKDDPMGLYTYDSDLNIDFADETRKQSKSKQAALKLMAAMANKRAAESKTAASSSASTAAADGKKSSAAADGKKSGAAADGKKGGAKNAAASANDVENPDEENATERGKKAPVIALKPYTTDIWEEDTDMVDLRHLVNGKFLSIWGDGIAAYIKGDWRKARDIFHETSKMSGGKDGPSLFLIDVIDHHGGSAPSDWKGYREESAGGH